MTQQEVYKVYRMRCANCQCEQTVIVISDGISERWKGCVKCDEPFSRRSQLIYIVTDPSLKSRSLNGKKQTPTP